MSRRAGILWFVGLAAFFLLLNRGAYGGFFDNDEIENINWTRVAGAGVWVQGFLTPLFQTNNFRPAGHFFFGEAGRYFGADFWKYIAALHAIHLLNVWLIWLVARRLGAQALAAGAACFVFAIHPALLEAVWKPMYVFDVLCGMFCLLSLLFYSQRRWVLSFAAFWLAYKSKELAIMLPPVLALYELWFGERKWLRLAPFFAVSASFGLQGVIRNPNHNNDYTLRFTPAAVWQTSAFYATQVLLAPFAGFLLPVAAWFARSRRAWFGVAMMALLFAPILFLPGRIFAAYCYAPFCGLALASSGFFQDVGRARLVAFLSVLFPIDPQAIAPQQQALLARDQTAREWFQAVARFEQAHPKVGAILYRGAPNHWGPVGCRSAVQYLYDDLGLPVLRDDDRAALPAAAAPVALLDWDPDRRVMKVTWAGPR